MAKINQQDFSKRRPKLTVDDLVGGDGMALVMAGVEEINVDDEAGKRKSLVLTFEESGEKVYYPNATSLGYILAAYGDESDDWVGQALPLLRHTGTFRGERYENLQVPPLDQWDHLVKGSGLKATHKGSGKTVKLAPKLKAKAGR